MVDDIEKIMLAEKLRIAARELVDVGRENIVIFVSNMPTTDEIKFRLLNDAYYYNDRCNIIATLNRYYHSSRVVGSREKIQMLDSIATTNGVCFLHMHSGCNDIIWFLTEEDRTMLLLQANYSEN